MKVLQATYAAMRQNPLAAFDEARIVSGDAHELGGEVALDGERNVAGTAGINAPAAVVVLVAHHLSACAFEAAGIAGFEQSVEEDVVGLEHRVGLELAAPEALGMLLREQEFPRAEDCRLHLGQIRIEATEFRRLRTAI